MTTLTTFDDFSTQADPDTVQIRAHFYLLRVRDCLLWIDALRIIIGHFVAPGALADRAIIGVFDDCSRSDAAKN